MQLLYPLAISTVVTVVILLPSAFALWWEGRQRSAEDAEGERL